MRVSAAIRALSFLALALYALGVGAQSFDLDTGREAVVLLDGQWRFHPGDSPNLPGTERPAWAAAKFDDSSWALLRSDASWSDQGYPGMSGYGWYRFTVKLPTGAGTRVLMLAPIVTSFEVYVDGSLVGQAGTMPPTMVPNTKFSFQVFPLGEAGSAARTLHVAIRVWHSPIWASYMGGGPFQGGSMAGDQRLLLQEQRHRQVGRNALFVDGYAYSIAAVVVGIAILSLFVFRPAEREYLWFAVMLLAQAGDAALNLGREIYAVPPIPVFDLLDGSMAAIDLFAAFCFFSRVLKARFGAEGRVLLTLVIVSPFVGVLYWPGWISVPTSATIQLALLLPAASWVLWLLVRRAVSGNRDAQLLLIPTLLDLGYYVADNVAIVLAQLGLTSFPRVLEFPLPLPPFTVHPAILLHLIFLLAMLVFLTQRFAGARQQEERLAGEFEAARQVQQVLLPDEADRCPGFSVEWIYQPADQVGGDFFQQISDGQQGMLIVVGDVSGKGLPAAMLVSVLVGAIRAEAAHGVDPAVMLVALNHRMMGRSQGGFTTCLAAHIAADGQLTVANAGHLPPYRNGEEVGVPGSLPLGIVGSAQYECTRLRLEPGDRLTFVSDGVVEAQSKSGELFGFERTRELSCQPAGVIAETARVYGQSDDITVVTVEFAGSAMQVAVI